MRQPKPLFAATILDVRKFEDTNTVKVIAKITGMSKAGGGPEDIKQIEGEPVQVCFRLRGHNFLDEKAAELTRNWTEIGLVKTNQEVAFRPGSTVYFEGVGPGEWDGKTTFRGNALHPMIKVYQNTISGRITTKLRRLTTVAAGVEVAKELKAEAETTEVAETV